jgi:hypothetical protein
LIGRQWPSDCELLFLDVAGGFLVDPLPKMEVEYPEARLNSHSKFQGELGNKDLCADSSEEEGHPLAVVLNALGNAAQQRFR